MGLYDDIACDYPLPGCEGTPPRWQTKSLSCQLDRYKIDDDGSLWVEAYDAEDRSNPDATGLARFAGCMTRVNRRWERCDFRGEILFYGEDRSGGWWEYSALFNGGQIIDVRAVEVPLNADAAEGGGDAIADRTND